jgi:serine/threonine protein kinase
LRGGKLNPREAMQIIPQICEALQFAHDEGIVHRDIKPENILLDKRGRVKIADFGIAKLVGQTTLPDARLTGAGDVVGTLNYMAPEQREKPLTVDHRADIFSLGVVFYELLTGELPIGKFAPPSQVAQVDVRLDEVVVRALEKEPARRYQHVSDLRTDVQNITAVPSATPPQLSPSPAPVTPPTSPAEETSDCRILPAFLLAFIFGLFGAHRFYVGKIGTAFLQLFTLGGLGIWATIDWILILCKAFKDKKGRRITKWT